MQAVQALPHAGIVWLFFEAFQYLERSREPGRRLARPMEFSRTRNPSGSEKKGLRNPRKTRPIQGKRGPAIIESPARERG